MRFALGLAVVGWMCTPATAQLFDDEVGHTVPWPTSNWNGGTVTTMVSGDFTGDLYRDLVLLDGPNLVLAFGAGYFTARSVLWSAGVTGVCVVPGGTVDAFDGLVAADEQGWSRISILYPSNQPGSLVDTDSFQDSDWIGAHCLHTIPGSTPVVAALDELGTKILFLTDPFGSATPSESGSLAGTGVALAVVNWNATYPAAVAVLHDQGVDIYDPASPSSPVGGYSLPQSTSLPEDGALVAFHQDGVGGRLAALIENGSGPRLWIVDYSDEADYALSVAEPYALAAGDVDDDGSDDLLVAHRDSNEEGPALYINEGTGSGGPFPTKVGLSLGVPWTDPSEQKAVPVIDDFTSDGDLDIAWYSEEEQGDDEILRVAENSTVNHTNLFVLSQTTRAKIDAPDEQGELRIKVAPSPGSQPFTPDFVLIESWYQHAEGPMHSIGTKAFMVPYPTSGWSTAYNLYVWSPTVPMTGWTHLTIRAIDADNTTLEVLEAGPAQVHSVALSEGAVAALESFITDQGQTFSYFSIAFGELSYSSVPGGPVPSYPQGEFSPNTWASAAGAGHPLKPPPMGDIAPPKTPKIPPP